MAGYRAALLEELRSESVEDILGTVMSRVENALYQVDLVSSDRLDTLQERVIEALQNGDWIKLRVFDTIMADRGLDLYVIYDRVELNAETSLLLNWNRDQLTLDNFCCKCIDEGNLELLRDVWNWVDTWPEHFDWSRHWLAAWERQEMEIVRWIWDETKLGLQQDDRRLGGVLRWAFLLACGMDLETAQWVWSLGELDQSYNLGLAFRAAWETGLELAQWVYSLGGCENAVEDLLYRTFDTGTLFSAETLCESFPFDADAYQRVLVRLPKACMSHQRRIEGVVFLMKRGAVPPYEQWLQKHPWLCQGIEQQLPRRTKSARS